MHSVRKRNGMVVSFDPTKIKSAMKNAFSETDIEINDEIYNQMISCIVDKYEKNYIPHVEEIQDSVENTLIEFGYIKTAKSYIIYRNNHEKIRNSYTVNIPKLIEDYVAQGDWRIKENSNMAYSLQGLNNYLSGYIESQYWLNTIYDDDIKQAHNNGDFHIHDLSMLSTYCCGWDLMDLLKVGFCGVSGKIESLPPKHFGTALGQIVNFLYTLQGEAAGAVAFSNFDTLLAPFVRYDKLSYQEVKQEMQTFIFNMNVPTRSGFQSTFSNITMDLQCPSHIASFPVIIGGEYQTETFSQFQNEMDMINKAFCEIMMEGDSKGRILSFPIPTYNLTKTFDWENPNLEILWKMTAKLGIPYFSNFINSDMNPDDAFSMCCRLRLDLSELKSRGGGLFGANPLTGSINVSTINLPRAAYLVKDLDGDKEQNFFKHIDGLLELCRRQMKIKRNFLEDLTEKGLYPYCKFYLRQVKQRSGNYWTNHFNTIGILGAHEAMINLIGKGIDSPEGQRITLNLLNYIREKLIRFQEEDNQIYNLEATPGESTTFRFAKKDLKDFVDIVTSGCKTAPYYTNSTNLPVNHTNDIFEALDHQDKYLVLYTGGSVSHGFLGEAIDDPNVCKKLVRTIAENYHLPYFSITPTFSVCPTHGYFSGEHKSCPHH